MSIVHTHDRTPALMAGFPVMLLYGVQLYNDVVITSLHLYLISLITIFMYVYMSKAHNIADGRRISVQERGVRLC